MAGEDLTGTAAVIEALSNTVKTQQEVIRGLQQDLDRERAKNADRTGVPTDMAARMTKLRNLEKEVDRNVGSMPRPHLVNGG